MGTSYRTASKILALAGGCLLSAADRARIGLNGAWEFRLDANAAGEGEAWQSDTKPFSDNIQVPGC